MKITILYDLRLYSRACLEQAKLAYSDYIENVVTREDATCEVTISNNEVTSEDAFRRLVGEFNNYVLQLENHMGAY